ncbi:MAG: 3-hydroxyacyl-ACP dehydratase FabZ [Armatimonadetes bacterium]|nr:3-hydroxyacyl-ACP dehydratase FabZ [Armatimonadota bacterium]MDE2207740.1 3-hydroxyacyl-ACP dehydratase FabZ [Armatimonadota bacterium]
MMDIEEIRSILPHRFPMLLVDRILEVQEGVRVVGLKNVTINEPFFVGHFPAVAVMPGVLIIESMAQVAGLMLLRMPDHLHKLVYIAEVERMRFRRPVVPGDTLITEATMDWLRGAFGQVTMVGRVNGEVVAEGTMKFKIMDSRGSQTAPARRTHLANGAVQRDGPELLGEDEASMAVTAALVGGEQE